MLKVTDAYRAAITAERRRMRLQAVLDLVDPDITYGGATTPAGESYDRPAQLYDKDYSGPSKLATLETGRWILDGTWDLFPSSPDDLPEDTEVGAIGTLISGADGAFSTPQDYALAFSGVSILQAAAVHFSEHAEDGTAADFVIFLRGASNEVLYSRRITGNTAPAVAVDGFTLADPRSLRISVTRWSLPGRRARAVELVPGVLEEWGDDEIAGLDLTQQVDVSCCSLPYGTAILTIDNASRRFEPRNKDGIFESIEERQGIPIRIGPVLPDGSVEYKQLGVFYQYSGGWRTSWVFSAGGPSLCPIRAHCPAPWRAGSPRVSASWGPILPTATASTRDTAARR